MNQEHEELKKHLHEMLARIDEQYYQARKPIIDRLCMIERMTPHTVFIPEESLKDNILNIYGDKS